MAEFQIEWIPTEALLALAKERGMPDGDDCPLDYAEPSDAARYANVRTFAEAVATAKDKLPSDFFGAVRIERIFKVNNLTCGERWEADAVWHVSGYGDSLDENEPHEQPEYELFDDDRICDAR